MEIILNVKYLFDSKNISNKNST